jgi:hypothetical protein
MSLVVSCWNYDLLRENIRFVLRGSLIEVTLIGGSHVRVKSSFIISNPANLDVAVLDLRCANSQRRPLLTTERPCRVTTGADDLPLTLKAGAAHVITAETDLELSEQAAEVLRRTVRDPALPAENSQRVFAVARALAQAGVDAYGRANKCNSEEGLGVGYGISHGEPDRFLDNFRTTEQSFVFRVTTGRGQEFESARFRLSFPSC